MAVARGHRGRDTDSGWAWLVCLSSFLVMFVVPGLLNSFGVLFVALLQEFRRSEAETAWIGSLAGGMTFFLGPVSSGLSARWGCRAVACAGSLLFLAGVGLSSVVDEMPLMYLTYGIVVGTSFSFLYFSAFAAMAVHFSKHLSLANGISFAGGGCGTIALSLLTDKLCTQFGFKMALRILGCLSAPLFLASLTFPAADTSSPVTKEKEKKKAGATRSSVVRKLLANLLRPSRAFQNKAFIIWTIAMALVLFCYYIPYVYLARLAEDLGIPSSQGSMLVGYCAIAQTAGKAIFGKLADFRALNRLHLTQMSLLVIAVATALLPLAQSYSALVTFCFVAGFFDGGFVTLIGLVVHEIVGRQLMAEALGTMYGVVALPMTIGPPVAGFFYDSLGNYHAIFLLCSGLLTSGICLMFLIPWLLPTQSDTKKPLLLSELPIEVFTPEGDARKDPEDPSLGHEEFLSCAEVERRLLPNEPSLEPRPRSFILFSIISLDNLGDCPEHADLRSASRNATSRLSVCKPGCRLEDVNPSPPDALRPADSADGGHSPERHQAVCSCVSVPELGISQKSSYVSSREIIVDVEAAAAFDSTNFVNCDPSTRGSELDWADETAEDTRLRSTSWNSSDSNISLKSESQVSDGTDDSGYVDGHVLPRSCDTLEDNSDTSYFSEEFPSSECDISSQWYPLSEEETYDNIDANSADKTAVSTSHPVTKDTPKLGSLENTPTEAENAGHRDYFSDTMESRLEQSTCAFAELTAADWNVTCQAEGSEDVFSRAMEMLLEKNLRPCQEENISEKRSSALYSTPANFQVYLSLSPETAI